MDEIDVFKTQSDGAMHKSTKMIYDLVKSPVYTKKYKRELMDVIIDTQSEFLEELKVLRDSI